MWTLWVLLSLSAVPSTKETATSAYRRGDLAKACPLFAQAVKEQPADASGWSDLGLCLARLGKALGAVEAMDRAISLGDAATRKAVYFNLGKQRLRAFVIDELIAADEKRIDWPAPAGCERRWSVRADSFSSCGTSYCHAGEGLWVGPREWVESQVSDPDADYQVTVRRSQQEFCGRDCWRYGTCDPCGSASRDLEGQRWPDLVEGPLVPLGPRIRACVGRKDAACRSPESCPELWSECADDACEVLRRRDPKELDPAEAALRAEILACIDACENSCQGGNIEEESFRGCLVVSVNPCAGAVGLVCPQGRGLKAVEVEIRGFNESAATGQDGGAR